MQSLKFRFEMANALEGATVVLQKEQNGRCYLEGAVHCRELDITLKFSLTHVLIMLQV